MNTVTISTMSDALHRRLTERAAANHRTIEDEALCCLQAAIHEDEERLSAIPPGRWAEVERSISETIQDRGTPWTDSDFQRHLEMARGSARQ